jgi:hypothetical protein
MTTSPFHVSPISLPLVQHSNGMPLIPPDVSPWRFCRLISSSASQGTELNPLAKADGQNRRVVVFQSDEQASRRVPYGNTSSQGESLPLTPLMTIAEGS